MNFQPNKPGAVVIYIQKAIRVETRISSKKLNQLGKNLMKQDILQTEIGLIFLCIVDSPLNGDGSCLSL